MVAGSLEESRDVESEVIETEGKAVLESCKGVAQDLAVTRVLHIVLSYAYLAVTVDILVFGVTGAPSTALGKFSTDVRKINLGSIFLSFLISLEEVVSHEAPDFSKLHALVVLFRKCLVLVLILGDFRVIDTDHTFDAVAERMSCEHELVSPAEGELETLGTEVGGILLRSVRSVNRRKFITVGKHILGITDISLTRELESALEHIEVESDVPLLRGLPGQV